MAIALDASLGTATNIAASTTVALTTSSAVAAGGFIVLEVSWFDPVTLNSVSGGSLTWAVDKQGSQFSENSALVSAQAPAGLASSTAITATFSGTARARGISGISFTGVASSSALDTTSGPTGVTPAATGWASASTAILAGSVLVAVCFAEVGATSTPTAGSTEAFDYTDSGNSHTMAYRIESSAGSYTVAGTWSSGAESVTNAAAYKAAAASGGGEPPELVMAPLIPT